MDSDDKEYSGELTTAEAKKFITDLAEFKAPVLLFSGGEPLVRKDMFELAAMARDLGIRPVLSTNGTLITLKVAEKIKATGFGYVGVSIDGIGVENDRFRRKDGAFNLALEGIRNCKAVGQKVGLRFTIHKQNYKDMPKILDLVEEEEIDRCCFYHLVYTGRGSSMMDADVSRKDARDLVDFIFERTKEFFTNGQQKEILTVDNHTDGVYLYLKMKEEDPARAKDIFRLLEWNGGNRSGMGIGAVDNLGNVHADQFWNHYTFGNVKEQKFGDIWTDTTNPLMKGLKNRSSLIKGRCSKCKYFSLCNGNFRARAEAVYGDVWESDPACYLSDKEIGIA